MEPAADDPRLLQAMGKLQAGAQALGQAVRGPLVSGISGRAAELGSFTKSAVQGAAEREKAEYRVARALETIGEYTDANYDRAIAFAGQLAKETSLTRDQAIAVEAVGIQLGKLSGAQLEDMTQAAVGWAERMHVGAEEAMRGIILAQRPEGEEARRMFEPLMPEGASLATMDPERLKAPRMPGRATPGIESALALAEALPGALAYPGAASMPGQPAAAPAGGLAAGAAGERAAEALETYLPIIAENTRKDAKAPYQVNP